MDLIIRDARLSSRPEDGLFDIGVENGRIAAIAPNLAADGKEHAVAGGLVCAGLIETHIHLDKSRIIERCPPEETREVNPVKSVAPMKKTLDGRGRARARRADAGRMHPARSDPHAHPGRGRSGYRHARLRGGVRARR
jgi:cytosine/creatinine deaminase